MKSILTGAAAIALLAAPASAQLLGGGGGIGGQLGGLGSVGGNVGGSLGRMGATTESATRLQRANRADRRAQRSLDASAAINARSLQTRGVAAATSRGLRRVTETARGVPVFVLQAVIAAPSVAVAVPRVYPSYDRSIYYGGPDTVFVSEGDVGGYMDRQYRDLERGVRGTGATVYRRGEDLIVQLPADVTFAFDRADIQPRFVRTLAAVADTLDRYRGTDVEIVGHTDAVGSEQYNLALSERRGRSVADFLVDHDAEPARLIVEAMGESEPVASNATIGGRAANRRVEIVLHPRTA